jgi:hypothetical protein
MWWFPARNCITWSEFGVCEVSSGLREGLFALLLTAVILLVARSKGLFGTERRGRVWFVSKGVEENEEVEEEERLLL